MAQLLEPSQVPDGTLRSGSSRPTWRLLVIAGIVVVVAGAGEQQPAGGAGGIEPPDPLADGERIEFTSRPTRPCKREKLLPAEAQAGGRHANQPRADTSRHQPRASHAAQQHPGLAQLMGEDTSVPTHRAGRQRDQTRREHLLSSSKAR